MTQVLLLGFMTVSIGLPCSPACPGSPLTEPLYTGLQRPLSDRAKTFWSRYPFRENSAACQLFLCCIFVLLHLRLQVPGKEKQMFFFFFFFFNPSAPGTPHAHLPAAAAGAQAGREGPRWRGGGAGGDPHSATAAAALKIINMWTNKYIIYLFLFTLTLSEVPK